MARRVRTEKMSVTLPGDLATEIRSTVSQGGVSAFFTEALEHYMSYRKQRIALEKGFGAWKDKKHPNLATPRDSTAYVRALRESDRERLKRLGVVSAK